MDLMYTHNGTKCLQLKLNKSWHTHLNIILSTIHRKITLSFIFMHSVPLPKRLNKSNQKSIYLQEDAYKWQFSLG